MGTVTFIKQNGNPEADAYRIIKEQYQKLYVKHEPSHAFTMTVAETASKKSK